MCGGITFGASPVLERYNGVWDAIRYKGIDTAEVKNIIALLPQTNHVMYCIYVSTYTNHHHILSTFRLHLYMHIIYVFTGDLTVVLQRTHMCVFYPIHQLYMYVCMYTFLYSGFLMQIKRFEV